MKKDFMFTSEGDNDKAGESMIRHGKGHTPSVVHPWKKTNHQLFNKRQSQRKKTMVVAM